MGDVWALVIAGAGAVAASFGLVIARARRMRNFEMAARMVEVVSPMFPNVPRSLALAIIAHESNFNATARNLKGSDLARGGAYGLMQVTLATALAMNVPPNVTWDRTGEGLLDPLTNVAFGMQVLSNALKEFHNDPDLAAAAYNRGNRGLKNALARGLNPREDPYVTAVRDIRESFMKEGYV